MITRENTIKVGKVKKEFALTFEEKNEHYKDAIFFDLEHYIYKKPICVGVFGCCYYNEKEEEIKVTQYMIENAAEVKKILLLARKYFKQVYREGRKKYIVTFSGNNDFTVINYLFKKYDIEYCISDYFTEIDLQKEYEKVAGICIGLKALEKKFEITRDTELISGSNLAKTFSKVMKDVEYFNRMPLEKKEKILLYNEQDVVSLFHIYTNWKKMIPAQQEENKDA